MGKIKRARKKERADLQKWFEKFSKQCPWRAQYQYNEPFCIAAVLPKDHAMLCKAINCAPLFIANRLIQMTFGDRIYDQARSTGKHSDQEK